MGIPGNICVIWYLILVCFHQHVTADTFVSAVKYDLWSHVASKRLKKMSTECVTQLMLDSVWTCQDFSEAGIKLWQSKELE